MNSKVYLINNSVTFDVGTMILTNRTSNDTVTLTRNLSECLFILISNHGEVISQDFLIDEVWVKKRMFISENTLVQNIRKLRAVINSIGLSKDFIVTKKGKGYYFSSDVEVELFDGEEKCKYEMENTDKNKNIDCVYPVKVYVSKAIYVSMFVVFFIISFLGFWCFYSSHYINATPKVEYYFNSNLKECFFYFDNKLGFDKSNVINIIMKQNEVSCATPSYIYITYYPLSAHYSYIKCDQEVSSGSESKICTSVVRYDYEKNN
ncbi:helix-turn-helix domain-containing protein [Klebsiella aerogenes]